MKSVLERLIGYAAYMFAATVVLRAVGFAVTLLGARLRAKENYGDFATFMMVVGIGTTALVGGVSQAIQRFAAADDEKLRWLAVWCVRAFLLLATFGLAGAGLAAPFLGGTFALSFLAVPWVVLIWWVRYLLRSRLNAPAEARIMAILEVAVVLLQLGFLVGTDLPHALIYGSVLAHLLTGLWAISRLPRVAGFTVRDVFGLKVPRAFIREVLAFAAPLWTAGVAFSAASQVQGAWIRGVLGAMVMGTYGLMQELWLIAQLPMELVGQAALPGLALESPERRRALLRDLVRLCMIVFPSVALGVAAGAPLLLWTIDRGFAVGAFVFATALDAPHVLPGEALSAKYAEVPPLLLLFVVDVPFRAFQVVVNQFAVAEGRPRISLAAHVVHIVSLAIMIYPATVAFGLPGVLVASALASVANALTYWVALRRDFPVEMGEGLRWSLQVTLVVVVALVPVYFGMSRPWAYFSVVPSLLVFWGGISALKVVGPEDFGRVLRLLRRKRAAV